MGMYDYVVYEGTLPGVIPHWYTEGDVRSQQSHVCQISGAFQTKDLECRMDTYTIHRDGSITCSAPGADMSRFTGEIEFYNDNWACVVWGHTFTHDGSDLHSVEYKAIFVAGELESITQTRSEIHPALPSSWQHEMSQKLQEELAFNPPNPPESFVGQTLYVRWGSMDKEDKGYYVKITQEKKRPRDWQLVAERVDNGEFEILSSSSYGSTLFLTKEDAQAYIDSRNKIWEAGVAAVQEELKRLGKI